MHDAISVNSDCHVLKLIFAHVEVGLTDVRQPTHLPVRGSSRERMKLSRTRADAR